MSHEEQRESPSSDSNDLCGCGHPVSRHFAAGGDLLAFGDRMCRERGCLCVRSGNPKLTGERYLRPLFDSERIYALEILVLALFDRLDPTVVFTDPAAVDLLRRLKEGRRRQ